MGVMHLTLLGGFEARLESGLQIDIPTRKAQAVLAYLALQPGKALSRDKLASLLWSDRGDKQAHGSLRQALTVLRKALETVDPPPLVVDRGCVAIEPAAVEVDAVAFDRLVAGSASGDLEAATALYQGDLLDGFVVRDPIFEEWLDCERARLHELMTRALTKLLDEKAANGAGDEAIALGQRLLTFDRLHEPAHRTLMRLYAARGQRDTALQQYKRCRELLDSELGVEPEAETEALYQAICEEQPIPAQAVAPIEAPASDTSGMGPATAGRDWRWVVVALAVVLVAGTGMLAWLRPWAPRVEPAVEANMAFPLPDKPSIAVLPFTNLSDDPTQQYFADGMADDLITDLSRVSGLDVFASEAAARYLVRGSVRRSDEQIRINAQLIDAGTGQQLWAERYDRPIHDVFAVQDEVTAQIVRALRVELSEPEVRRLAERPTANLEAYDELLRGDQLLATISEEKLRRARAHFLRAVQLDPLLAEAWASLSRIDYLGWLWQWADQVLDLDRGLRWARQAVELAPDSPSAASSLSLVHLFRKEHEAALREGRRAHGLAPRDPAVLSSLGGVLIFSDQLREGLELVEESIQLDPGQPFSYISQGQAYRRLGRRDDSIRAYETALEQAPGSVASLASLAVLYEETGSPDDATAAIEKLREVSPRFSGAVYAERLPYRDPLDAERVAQGLARVGLP